MREDLFIHTLKHLRYGQTQTELSEKLSEAVKMASETGKMATVTLTLKIKPEANGKQVFFTDDIKAAIPAFPREQTLFFPTEDGNLQREDPRQSTLPGLRRVETETPETFKSASV